jgi:CheY-like chemotaxis protein
MSPGSTRILLVEDEPNDVLFVERAFRRLGLSETLSVAKDGQEAIDHLLGLGEYQDRIRFPLPTLMLLDLKLPRKSGFEVLSEMRLHPELRHVAVIVLTSSQEPADMTKAKELGARDYRVKPTGFDALMKMIQEILGSVADVHPS